MYCIFPGINDGAAALVMMSAREAEKRHLSKQALGRFISYAETAVDPSKKGIASIDAIKNSVTTLLSKLMLLHVIIAIRLNKTAILA